jgi:GDPmannose 4,6-dehydratase
MHLMMQQSEPADYVVATGESHSVREFCEIAFSEAGLDYKDFVKIDEAFCRPAEVDLLVGDSSKAKAVLDWQPNYDFVSLVKEMLHTDLELITSSSSRGLHLAPVG